MLPFSFESENRTVRGISSMEGRELLLKALFPQERRYDWTGRLSNVRGIGPESVNYRAIGRLGSPSTVHYDVLRECRPRGIVSSGR